MHRYLGLQKWINRLRSLRPAGSSGQRRPGKRVRHLLCELLEDRRLLALGNLLHTLANPAPVSYDLFGASVAVSGSTVIVGSPYKDYGAINSGVVYVFDATVGNLLGTIANPTPAINDNFGGSLAVSGNTAVVGARGDDTGATDAGAAYVFDATTLNLLHTLNNPTPVASDGFGGSVAVSGSTVVVGAMNADTGATNSGMAYVFDAATGNLLHTLVNPTPAAGDGFGISVAISGSTVVVGAWWDDTGATDAGAAYVFDAATGRLLRTLNNPAPQAGDSFGRSVAVSGSTIVVGAYEADVGATGAGAAYVFDVTSGNLLHALNNPTPTASDNFGGSVAVSESTIVVGAPNDHTGETDIGAVYVFDVATGNLLRTLINPTPTASDDFGKYVAASGDTVVVGDSREDGASIDQGTAFVFDGGRDSTDIRLESIEAHGSATLVVTYEIISGPTAPFEIGLYRSADTAYQTCDEQLGAVVVNNTGDLTTGLHRLEFAMGSGSGQVPMPGVGAIETDDEYYLLGVADPTNAVPEQDVDPVNDDNTVVFTGVYNAPSVNGDVYVFGSVTADTVTIHPNGVQLTFNGYTFDYANAQPVEYRVRTYGGDDAVSASGSSRPVWVHGGAGNDVLIGGSGNDTLLGGDGNDLIVGAGGNDRLEGNAGLDFYSFDCDEPLGNDTVHDAEGRGELWFQDTTTQPITVDLSQITPQVINSNLTLTLTAGDVIWKVVGGSLDDTLVGNALDNSLGGGPGNDTLFGGAGDDSYDFDADEPLGSDTIVDTSGVDTLWFPSTTTKPVRVDLSQAGPQVVNDNLTLTLSAGDSIENVIGGSLDDTLIGNALGNNLDGGPGNDLLVGAGGNDTLLGGDGDDKLYGQEGNDTLLGGNGNDTYEFDTDTPLGIDTLTDVSGADTLWFAYTTTQPVALDLSKATSQLVNPYLTLTLSANNSIVRLLGGELDDTLIGNALNNDIWGGPGGNDTLQGGEGNDWLNGDAGDDIFLGGAGDDTYQFDADTPLGSDTLLDASGADTLWFVYTTTQPVTVDLSRTTPQIVNPNLTLTLSANNSIVRLLGGELDDTLIGNALDNAIYAGGGNDILVGGDGNDWLEGGPGNDTLQGGDGNDTLHGQDGNDTLFGGNGNDTYEFDADTPLGSDTLVDASGADTLWFASTTTQPIRVDLAQTGPQVVNANLTLTLAGSGMIHKVLGGSLDDTVIGAGVTQNLWLWGAEGNDLLIGGSGNDLLEGCGGNDTLQGGGGDDTLRGQEGADTLLGGDGNDVLDGGPGRDLLVGGGQADQLFGGDDQDILIGGTTGYTDQYAGAVDRIALAKLMSEWTRLDVDYATRVDHLSQGTGLNSPYRLDASTWQDDNVPDTLQGDAELDWFLVHADDATPDWMPNVEIRTLPLTIPPINLVTNPSFESGTPNIGGRPTVFSTWEGDTVSYVGAQNSVRPPDGSRMLKFTYGYHWPSQYLGSQYWQNIDLSQFRSQIAYGNVAFTASALFNRIRGDAQTDTQFVLAVTARSGTPSSYVDLNSWSADLFSDGDVTSWEALTLNHILLPPDTDFLFLEIKAAENVYNDASGTEFDGHYADAIAASLRALAQFDGRRRPLIRLRAVPDNRDRAAQAQAAGAEIDIQARGSCAVDAHRIAGDRAFKLRQGTHGDISVHRDAPNSQVVVRVGDEGELVRSLAGVFKKPRDAFRSGLLRPHVAQPRHRRKRGRGAVLGDGITQRLGALKAAVRFPDVDPNRQVGHVAGQDRRRMHSRAARAAGGDSRPTVRRAPGDAPRSGATHGEAIEIAVVIIDLEGPVHIVVALQDIDFADVPVGCVPAPVGNHVVTGPFESAGGDAPSDYGNVVERVGRSGAVQVQQQWVGRVGVPIAWEVDGVELNGAVASGQPGENQGAPAFQVGVPLRGIPVVCVRKLSEIAQGFLRHLGIGAGAEHGARGFRMHDGVYRDQVPPKQRRFGGSCQLIQAISQQPHGFCRIVLRRGRPRNCAWLGQGRQHESQGNQRRAATPSKRWIAAFHATRA
ncbi:MAG: hypothetical protein NTY19_19460 [Planctomycetota bacterium]|nr:hypothetical protein [Planctomycetota bacterium]